MRSYETATIWSTSLTDAELEKELDKVRKIIASAKGTFLGTDAWGKRQLAYPIRKQTEGVYVFLIWEGDESVTAGIDKHLRISEPCLRYLTLRSDHSGEVPVPPAETAPAPPAAPEEPAAEAAPAAEEVPVEEEEEAAPAEEAPAEEQAEEEAAAVAPVEEQPEEEPAADDAGPEEEKQPEGGE